MNNLQALGKFLDQPVLVAKFHKSVPAILAGTTALYTAFHTLKAPEGEKKKTAVNTGITLGIASASAVAAPRIAASIIRKKEPVSLTKIKDKSKKLINQFLETNKTDKATKKILEKCKNKVLDIKEIKTLYKNLSNDKNGKKLLEKLVPPPKNESAEDIFDDIGYLSILGAVPVAGGIMGGIAADKITDKNNFKEKISDKIKEGSYQYLANIFMCNIGAGAALAILEQAEIKSKAARAIGMTAGIIATGIIGGSKIANKIGEKVIDPVCDKLFGKNQNKQKFNDVLTIQRKERTPELLDIGLHTDDIATVSVLSGLKWIEPALPLMYTISGYRAGIGYRN